MLVALVIRSVSLGARRASPVLPQDNDRTHDRSDEQTPPARRRFHPWQAFKHLTTLGFPRRFPIVQFPNLPLIVAFLASQVGGFVRGSGHSFAQSVSYLAMTIWAYEELTDGVNWFRRLLGLTYVIILVIRVAHAVQA